MEKGLNLENLNEAINLSKCLIPRRSTVKISNLASGRTTRGRVYHGPDSDGHSHKADDNTEVGDYAIYYSHT